MTLLLLLHIIVQDSKIFCSTKEWISICSNRYSIVATGMIITQVVFLYCCPDCLSCPVSAITKNGSEFSTRLTAHFTGGLMWWCAHIEKNIVIHDMTLNVLTETSCQ